MIIAISTSATFLAAETAACFASVADDDAVRLDRFFEVETVDDPMLLMLLVLDVHLLWRQVMTVFKDAVVLLVVHRVVRRRDVIVVELDTSGWPPQRRHGLQFANGATQIFADDDLASDAVS